MHRRDTLKRLGITLGALPFAGLPFGPFEHMTVTPDDGVLQQLDRLTSEPPCRCEVRMERGGARLFLNGIEAC
jgi:hypothetical protein